MKKLLFLFGVFFLLCPLTIVFADGTYYIGEISPNSSDNICYTGLVPCGKKVIYGNNLALDSKGNCPTGLGTTTSSHEVNCQFCHFFIMIKGILAFVFRIVIVIAILMTVISGMMILVCSGNPGCISKAWSILKSTGIGLVIMFSAWIIVGTIFVRLGVQGWTGLASWHQINCPIENRLSVKTAGKLDPSTKVTGGGIDCGSVCISGNLNFGADITLTAQGTGANTVRWSDKNCRTGNTCNIKMEGSKSVTATFK